MSDGCKEIMYNGFICALFREGCVNWVDIPNYDTFGSDPSWIDCTSSFIDKGLTNSPVNLQYNPQGTDEVL